MATPQRKSYVSYTMGQKLKFVEELEAGKPLSKLVMQQNIPKSTLGTWMKQKENNSLALSKVTG